MPDGTCIVMTQADCAAANGVFRGPNTKCNPNLCPPPPPPGVGACCAPSGNCTLTNAAACAAAGGTFSGAGTTCIPNLCPVPTSACCLPNNTCSEISQVSCQALGGMFRAGELCSADDDNDGVPNCQDQCPGTPDGNTLCEDGCACIICDTGGPYDAVCTGGFVTIQLNGTSQGQVPPNQILVSLWTTTCAGAVFADPTDPKTTVTIDTALAGCPLQCDITLTCMFIPGPNAGGNAPLAHITIPPPVTTTTGVGLFLDCNGNMIDDVQDIANGTSLDCNQNGIPDECDVAQRDCNGNGIPDDCDVDPNDPDGDGQVSADCNGNGIPDECELPGNDCNGNGILDECEPDCNNNGVPDDCDIDPTDPDGDGQVWPDCQPNGVPDVCDIASGTSRDDNNDGIPDECQGGCNPDEVGVSVLFSNLFRAPVCGIGCPAFILASFVGLASMRFGYGRRRRRR